MPFLGSCVATGTHTSTKSFWLEVQSNACLEQVTGGPHILMDGEPTTLLGTGASAALLLLFSMGLKFSLHTSERSQVPFSLSCPLDSWVSSYTPPWPTHLEHVFSPTLCICLYWHETVW